MQHRSYQSSLFSKTPAIAWHFLFWLGCYYLFAVLISLTIHQIHDWHFYLELLTLIPPDIVLVYLNLYWLIPRFLFKRKFPVYFILLSAAIFLHAALDILMHRLYARAGTSAYVNAQEFNLRNFSIQIMNAIYLLGLTSGLKFIKDWMLQEQHWREKERQHAQTELNFLRAQIHPHFFFNTLNNLYSLTIQKSDLAPEVVLKLSELMNYMLYESGAPRVPLDKEIATLENYIAIEQLRFGRRLELSFEKEGPTGLVNIPPLLLLAFIENSFKHGLRNNIGQISIVVRLRIGPEHLHFTVTNPAEVHPEGPDHPPGFTPPHGIGLKNVKRRLDLLYGKDYILNIGSADGKFTVDLKIPIE